jgi:hypothetical protein
MKKMNPPDRNPSCKGHPHATEPGKEKGNRMKKTLLIPVTLGLLGAVAFADTTQTTATEGTSSTGLAASDDRFEAGAIFGEPTGVSLKYWLNDTFAVDGAAGWSFHDEDDLHLHSDVLWHKFDVFKVSKGQLPLYFGVGGRVKFRDNADDKVGIRFPVGISYLFEDAPVSLFLEVAPVLDVAPDTDGDFTAGIGVRFRF